MEQYSTQPRGAAVLELAVRQRRRHHLARALEQPLDRSHRRRLQRHRAGWISRPLDQPLERVDQARQLLSTGGHAPRRCVDQPLRQWEEAPAPASSHAASSPCSCSRACRTENQAWNIFVTTILQETNEIESAPVRGSGAFNDYDFDSDDDGPDDYGFNDSDSDEGEDRDLDFVDADDEPEELINEDDEDAEVLS